MRKHITTERQYTAFCDDGHDFFSFEYYSTHRAGSKANEEDARDYYRRKHGTRYYTIKNVSYNKEPIL